MSEFYEYIESAKNADSLPEDFWEEVSNKFKSFEDRYNTATAGAQTTLKEREQAIKDREADIQKLQAMNFQLLQGQSVDNDDAGDDNGEQEPESQGIDSLFT